MYLEVGVDPSEFLGKPETSAPPPAPGKPFMCEHCFAHFTTYKGMKQHIGKVHLTKSKHVKCPKCGNKFKHKYALKFHIKQVHESSTRVKCPECDKILYNKYTLKKHLQVCATVP